jgi:hypothetical protein
LVAVRPDYGNIRSNLALSRQFTKKFLLPQKNKIGVETQPEILYITYILEKTWICKKRPDPTSGRCTFIALQEHLHEAILFYRSRVRKIA